MFKVKNMTKALVTVSSDYGNLAPLVLKPGTEIEVSEQDIATNFSSALSVMSSAEILMILPSGSPEVKTTTIVDQVEEVEKVQVEIDTDTDTDVPQSDKLQLIKSEVKALEVEYKHGNVSADRKAEIKKLILEKKRDIKALK